MHGANPEFFLLVFFLLLLPIVIFQYFIKCKTRWKVLYSFISILIEIFIILNQSSLCSFIPLACSFVFSIAVMVFVPIIIYLIIINFCPDNKNESLGQSDIWGWKYGWVSHIRLFLARYRFFVLTFGRTVLLFERVQFIFNS